jgi:hypothetical protein
LFTALPVVEPLVLVDHSAVEERHDGQPAAEHERPCLGEEQGQVSEGLSRRLTELPGGQAGSQVSPRAVAPGPSRGGAFTSIDTTPHRRKTQTISDSVQAVVRALAANTNHSRWSLPIVRPVTLQVLRTMMAITAAPMP